MTHTKELKCGNCKRYTTHTFIKEGKFQEYKTEEYRCSQCGNKVAIVKIKEKGGA